MSKAIGMYWDYYYKKSHELEKLYPNNFKVFITEKVFNTIGIWLAVYMAG